MVTTTVELRLADHDLSAQSRVNPQPRESLLCIILLALSAPHLFPLGFGSCYPHKIDSLIFEIVGSISYYLLSAWQCNISTVPLLNYICISD